MGAGDGDGDGEGVDERDEEFEEAREPGREEDREEVVEGLLGRAGITASGSGGGGEAPRTLLYMARASIFVGSNSSTFKKGKLKPKCIKNSKYVPY